MVKTDIAELDKQSEIELVNADGDVHHDRSPLDLLHNVELVFQV